MLDYPLRAQFGKLSFESRFFYTFISICMGTLLLIYFYPITTLTYSCWKVKMYTSWRLPSHRSVENHTSHWKTLYWEVYDELQEAATQISSAESWRTFDYLIVKPVWNKLIASEIRLFQSTWRNWTVDTIGWQNENLSAFQERTQSFSYGQPWQFIRIKTRPCNNKRSLQRGGGIHGQHFS